MTIFFVTIEYIEPYTKTVISGGLANYLHKITTALQKQGHEVHVVIIDKLKLEMNYNGIHLHFIKNKQNRVLSKLERLARLVLKELKININIKITKNNTALIAKKFLLKACKKYAIDIIQYTSYHATGQYPLSNIPSCVRISSYEKLFQKASGFVDKNLLDNEIAMFRNSRFIFGPSNRTNAIITSDLRLKQEIKTIETPFVKYDAEEDHTVYNQLKGIEYVLFVGTAGKLKGINDIGAIIYYFLKEYQKTAFVFAGKQILVEGIPVIQIIKEKSIEYKDRIIWFDNLPHRALYPVIRGAKAVVLPSRYDNLPNVCVEAMSLNKVVLGTYEGSFDQFIKDGENGFLIPAANPSLLLLGLERIMNTPAIELQKMGEKAGKTVMNLEPEKIAEKLIDYYQYVIDNW